MTHPSDKGVAVTRNGSSVMVETLPGSASVDLRMAVGSALQGSDPSAPLLPLASSVPLPAGTGSSSASVAVPQPQSPVAQQISRMILSISSDETVLRLDPEELGSVSLSLRGDDRSMTLLIQAERPETLELIRRNIGDLARELAGLGYEEIGFSFGTSRHDQDNRQQGGHTTTTMPASEETPNAAPGSGTTPITSTGHVDIRL